MTVADFMARHIVAIVGLQLRHSDRKVGTTHGTGFLLSYRNVPFLLTAGHVVKELEDLLDAAGTTLQVSLIDSIHGNAPYHHAVPLPFEACFRIGIDTEGMDYGAILLPKQIADQLYANNIVPVVFENWRNPPEQFDSYFLVGTPGELVEIDHGRFPPPVRKARGIMVRVRPRADPPESMKKPFQQFFGEIDISPDPTEDGAIHSIGGMSGCPLIGFKLDGEISRYWFYGIQSSWSEHKVIAVCPFKPFAEYLQGQIDRILDAPEEQGA